MSEVGFDGREYGVEFHHVQMYADSIKDIKDYKLVEDRLNKLAHQGSFDPFSGGMRFLEAEALPERVNEGMETWNKLAKPLEILAEPNFTPAGQDIVEQLIVGLGWRVTAGYSGAETRSVLVTSQDAKGVKIVITAPKSLTTSESKSDEVETYDHFDIKHLERFKKQHKGAQGVAVLGFEIAQFEGIQATYERYQRLHPKLVIGKHSYQDTRTISRGSENEKTQVVLGTLTVLEVFAYYVNDKSGPADQGTILRFVHRSGTYGSKEGFGNPQGVLPGLEDVVANFDGTSIPAYADHWVSNVTDRRSFLETLEEVLGFTPKVDFNAGVVAAGQAKIESTVTGNNKPKVKNTCDSDEILRDQSQIYLPTNNALSHAGHVALFLDQYGQGIQHLASRVADLTSFVERVNNYRKITGRGFSFLNIPRSYYGRLTLPDIASVLDGNTNAAQAILNQLVQSQLVTVAGIVQLEIKDKDIKESIELSNQAVPDTNALIHVIKQARYSNLYALLRDHFDEQTYLKIVTNKILVDVQGKDVLFQIFTCNILQRKAGEEAPFLEFIQRVCSQKKGPDGACLPIKPGCGGFGIRNFLTLFLSIEVSKAMNQVESAVSSGDRILEEKARSRVDLFTRQLEESNPILTDISDAMTAEGEAREKLAQIESASSPDLQRIESLKVTIAQQEALKLQGNEKLQSLSERYSQLMAQFQ